MSPCLSASALPLAAQSTTTLVIVLLLALGLGLVLAAIIKRARMTPEEKAAAEAALEAERVAESQRIIDAEAKETTATVAAQARRAALPPPPPEAPTPGLETLGYLLLWGGLLTLFFFAFLYSAVVEVGNGRGVNNIGLLNDRLIGTIISCFTTSLGALCFLTQRILDALPPKPKSAAIPEAPAPSSPSTP